MDFQIPIPGTTLNWYLSRRKGAHRRYENLLPRRKRPTVELMQSPAAILNSANVLLHRCGVLASPSERHIRFHRWFKVQDLRGNGNDIHCE